MATKSSNLSAAQSGDRRRALEQIRDSLAQAMDEVTGPALAQIAAQYRATLADLDQLADAGEESAADGAAARVLRIAGT